MSKAAQTNGNKVELAEDVAEGEIILDEATGLVKGQRVIYNTRPYIAVGRVNDDIEIEPDHRTGSHLFVPVSKLNWEGKRKPVDDGENLLTLAVQALQNRAVWRQAKKKFWMCARSDPSGVWRAEHSEGVSNIIVDTFGGWSGPLFTDIKEGHKVLTALRAELHAPLAVPDDIFDQQPWLLATASGPVDLRTGKLETPDPTYYLIKSTPHAYKPKAKCPHWLDHLNTLFLWNKELIHVFHKHIGALLVGDASTQKPQVFLWLEGPSGSGKGVTVRTLAYVLGEYAQEFSPKDFTKKVFERHLQWMMDLRGVRLAIVQEVADGELNVALVKSLTGGDKIKAHLMRENDETFDPSHTLVFTSNLAPDFGTDTEGVERRYVPFMTGPKQKATPGYEDALKAEAEGILAWCIEGCRLWLEEDGGGEIPLTVEQIEQRDAHIFDHDEWSDFIESVILVYDQASCIAPDIQQAYNSYRVQCGDLMPMNEKDPRWGKLYTRLDHVPGVHGKSKHPYDTDGSRGTGPKRTRGWVGCRPETKQERNRRSETGDTKQQYEEWCQQAADAAEAEEEWLQQQANTPDGT